MKQQASKQFLLTTALLAVLGGNYALQTSSFALEKQRTISGSFEMASRKPNAELASSSHSSSKIQTIVVDQIDDKETKNKKPDSNTVIINGKSFKNLTTDEKFERLLDEITAIKAKQTEAVSIKEKCETGECKPVADESIKKATQEIKVLTAKMEELKPVARLESKEPTQAELEQERLDEACPKEENEKPSEKRERQSCLKKEKEKIASEKNEERFKNTIERLTAKCDANDLNCLADGFNSTLNNFSGRKKLSQSFVTAQFAEVVGKKWAKELYNTEADQSKLAEITAQLFDSVPGEYKFLREKMLASMKTQAAAKAIIVNSQFKQAQTMLNQKNPQSVQVFAQAQQGQQEVLSLTGLYNNAILSTDLKSDAGFMAYYQKNYMPDMQVIAQTMTSPQGIMTSVQEQQQMLNPQQQQQQQQNTNSTRGNGGRTGIALPQQIGQSAQGVQGNTQGQQWTFQNAPNAGMTTIGGTIQQLPNNFRGSAPMNTQQNMQPNMQQFQGNRTRQ